MFTAVIPEGLASILQHGDSIVNTSCKKFFRRRYSAYIMSDIERLRNIGKDSIANITRGMLMT